MEIVFLIMLVGVMAAALGSGYPVAFALPGAAILTIGTAAFVGYLVVGDASAYFAQGSPVQWLSAGVTNFRGIYWEVERDTLIAIPLFVFMGIMLQRSKIAEDLLITMAQLFGPIPGGLGISVVFVGALLAATTGIVGATVVAMGLISLPAMMRNNYSNSLATGTIAASGTLGQIIPPSIVLIILADQLASATDQASSARKLLYKESTGELTMPSEFDVISTSAGDMFMGAFVPGLVLVILYMLYVLLIALLRPKMAPAVHYDGLYDRSFFLKVLGTLVPPLTLIFVVLGSIIAGIATVNQAGAIGAVGATIMAGYRLCEGQRGTYRPAFLAVVSVFMLMVIAQVAPVNVKNISSEQDKLALILAGVATGIFVVSVLWSGWRVFRVGDTLRSVMVETAKTTSLVFIILLGAAMLTAAFRAFGGEELVRHFLTSLPGGFWGQFIMVMVVIFLLGFFLDFIEIAVVVVPIVAPILLADPSANVTAVWLGVMIGLNIQTSFLTPPFGFALFYLRGVASAAVKTLEMYRGVIPFIILQLLALVIVANYPKLVNYVPTRISLTSDTAPPPLNPRLQFCLEENLLREYVTRESELRDAIARTRQLDMSYVPAGLRKDVEAALDKADRTFDLLGEIRQAEAIVIAAQDDYRPLHTKVREIERQQRRLESELDELRTRQSRLEADTSVAKRDALAAQIATLESQHAALQAEIPESWEEQRKTFQALQKAEAKVRQTYRRNVDDAYTPIRELLAIIADTDKLAALQGDLEQLRQYVAEAEPADSVEPVTALSAAVREVEGAGDVRSPINDARRALRNKTPDKAKALESLDEALQLYQQELAWRKQAKAELLVGVQDYEATIRNNIGLRQQPQLPREKALEIVSCTAAHRDISLNF